MAFHASALPKESHRIALLVMRSNGALSLCPFFGKCDGVLVIDPQAKSRTFHANEHGTTRSICDLILRVGANRLICGFVSEPEQRKLQAAGIDLRLGSCAWTIEDLAASFDDLPTV
jgi:hypothetical protein